jgi:hypothetical protein
MDENMTITELSMMRTIASVFEYPFPLNDDGVHESVPVIGEQRWRVTAWVPSNELSGDDVVRMPEEVAVRFRKRDPADEVLTWWWHGAVLFHRDDCDDPACVESYSGLDPDWLAEWDCELFSRDVAEDMLTELSREPSVHRLELVEVPQIPVATPPLLLGDAPLLLWRTVGVEAIGWVDLARTQGFVR